MTSNENFVNIKVIELIEIYNFYFGHLFLQLNLDNSNFQFQKMITSNKSLRHQMIQTEKVMYIKVVVLINIYDFYFGHSFI
jgi:hypothetical protein